MTIKYNPSSPNLPTRFLARLMHEHNAYLNKPTRIWYKRYVSKVTVIAHTFNIK